IPPTSPSRRTPETLYNSEAGHPDLSFSLVRHRFASGNAEEWVPACAGMTGGVGRGARCVAARSLTALFHSSLLSTHSWPLNAFTPQRQTSNNLRHNVQTYEQNVTCLSVVAAASQTT